MNPFKNIISSEFTSLFDNAIDAIIDPSSGLVNPCTIVFASNTSETSLCNNCIFDNVSLLSSNMYNGTGPQPFADGGICPICYGSGYVSGQNNQNAETINLAVITDLKYFINIGDYVNINNNSIQTICSEDILPKLNNSIELVFNGIAYQKASPPQMTGLSKHRYAIIIWRPK